MSQPVVLFTHRDTTKGERALLGKTKQETEEIQHEFSQLPDTVGVKPLSFAKSRRGATYVEWAWSGDNIVTHVGWTSPMILNKRVVCRSLVNLLYPVIPRDLQVTIKAPFHEVEGGAYTVIFNAIGIRPGAESFFLKKVLPSLLKFNPSVSIPRGPVSR